MPLLYLLVVKIAQLLLPLAAGISSSKKLKLFVQGRKHLFDQINLEPHAERYWFHCASLGEFEQARPVMEAIKKQKPQVSIVVSFFSPSGYEYRKNYALADKVFYLPLDTPSNAGQLLKCIKPAKVFFVKYELWYFILNAVHKKGIPAYLISANFRDNQFVFSFAGTWLFKTLKGFNTIFVQNESTLQLLQKKGISNAILTGDTRYDRVYDHSRHVNPDPALKAFKQNKPLLILGSSWPREEQILLDGLQKNSGIPYKIIIAPHDISLPHITAIQKQFAHLQPELFTEYNGASDTPLMILNTIGHLAGAYALADYAFIGGGFTGQLHNILEPLSFGAAVITGPIHHKFPEAEEAKNAGVLFEINTGADLALQLSLIPSETLKGKAAEFVHNRTGATDKIIKTIGV